MYLFLYTYVSIENKYEKNTIFSFGCAKYDVPKKICVYMLPVAEVELRTENTTTICAVKTSTFVLTKNIF